MDDPLLFVEGIYFDCRARILDETLISIACRSGEGDIFFIELLVFDLVEEDRVKEGVDNNLEILIIGTKVILGGESIYLMEEGEIKDIHNNTD